VSYESLVLAGTILQGVSKIQKHVDDTFDAIILQRKKDAIRAQQLQNAIVQSGINNQLATNTYLYIRREDALDLAKLSFDKTMIQQKIRRERASFAVIGVQRGATIDASGSFAAGDANIVRHGLKAIQAKDINRDKRVLDFAQRIDNTTLKTLSANNTLFSQIDAPSQIAKPSLTGLFTDLAATGIQGLTIAERGVA